jgi:hypothetical protein
MVAHTQPTAKNLELALEQLGLVRDEGTWPRGRRDLWTDAVGVVLLLSLYQELGEERYLAEAEWVAAEVDRVLGRRRGIRMGEGPDSQGQTFRSQALWLFALNRLGEFRPPYRRRAMSLVREIHAPFVRPYAGVIARMEEGLKAPFPGSGRGELEVFLGLVVYRLLGEDALAAEIEEMEELVRRTCPALAPDHGVDLGLLLWITHFFPCEPWSLFLRERALAALDARWVDPPGYFRRNLPEPWGGPPRTNLLAIANLGASVGLQAQGLWKDRVQRLHRYFLSDFPWEDSRGDPLPRILTASSVFPGLLFS